jgi:integrase
MARRVRSATLETRTARLKLPIRKKPHAFTPFAPGISLGYRRCQGPGRWVVRVANGKGGAWIKNVGFADDFEGPDNEHIFDYWRAQERARKLARGQDGDSTRPATVAEAIDDYARHLEKNDGDPENASRARFHLTPTLLAKPVALLTARELRHWRDGLDLKPATLNRTLKATKAVLNLAARLDPQRITNAQAWRDGLEGLKDAHNARNAVLPKTDVAAIVREAWAADAAFGLLVELLAVAGPRISQVARLEVGDLQDDRKDPRLQMPSSRKGKGRKRVERRPVPIPAGLAAKLRDAAGNRPADARLLLKTDGTPWRPEASEHLRPFAETVARAGLPASVTSYSLRHSSIVRQLLANIPLKVVASHHDTSPAMIERTYGRYISDHSDDLVRRTLLDLSPAPDAKVAALPGRRS